MYTWSLALPSRNRRTWRPPNGRPSRIAKPIPAPSYAKPQNRHGSRSRRSSASAGWRASAAYAYPVRKVSPIVSSIVRAAGLFAWKPRTESCASVILGVRIRRLSARQPLAIFSLLSADRPKAQRSERSRDPAFGAPTPACRNDAASARRELRVSPHRRHGLGKHSVVQLRQRQQDRQVGQVDGAHRDVEFDGLAGSHDDGLSGAHEAWIAGPWPRIDVGPAHRDGDGADMPLTGGHRAKVVLAHPATVGGAVEDVAGDRPPLDDGAAKRADVDAKRRAARRQYHRAVHRAGPAICVRLRGRDRRQAGVQHCPEAGRRYADAPSEPGGKRSEAVIPDLIRDFGDAQ